MKISELKENKSNPRKINKKRLEALKKSLSDYPNLLKLRPIVVDENNVVLGGNQRLRAMKELGWKDVPDEYVKSAEELTEAERKRFVSIDNVSFGDWSDDGFADVARELEDLGLEEFLFDEKENEIPTIKEVKKEDVERVYYLFSVSLNRNDEVADMVTKIRDLGVFVKEIIK